MATKKIRIALGDINRDSRFRVRDIDGHKIAVFRDLLKVGAILPPYTIDQNSVLITGNHRHEALLKVYGVTYKVSVTQIEFKNDIERLKYAGEENQKNGYRLTAFEEKRLAFRLQNLGADEEAISKAIGRPVSKILNWHDNALIVIDPAGKEHKEPRKGGIDKVIKNVTQEQYDTIAKKNSGWSPAFHVDQIILHIENKTINLENEQNVYKLRELVEIIEKILPMEATA